MRIALCLSGLPRAIEEAYPYIKKALLETKHEVDIFAHAWLEDPWREGSHEKYLTPVLEYETRLDQIKKILDIYKPKSFQVDSYHIRQEYYQSSKEYILYTRYCSMLESVYIANNLKKRYEEQNHFKYDCVIRCRYDTGFLHSFDFESYDLENYVYVPDVGKDPMHHLNDMFAFSCSERMDKWCELFLHMKEMAEKVIEGNAQLAEMYVRTRNGPDNHDLYAYWNRTQQLGATPIPVGMQNARIDGKILFR